MIKSNTTLAEMKYPVSHNKKYMGGQGKLSTINKGNKINNF